MILAEPIPGAVALLDQVGQVVTIVGRRDLALSDTKACLEIVADATGDRLFLSAPQYAIAAANARLAS